MDATRWQRTEEIFHEIADDPIGPQRDAKLLALCGADGSLAADVRALLAEDERQGLTGDHVDPHVGLRLGNYLVEGLIARGGMAGVYHGSRADDTFHQRVAVKIMDVRLAEPALVAQFSAERQILAALEHPALTRLLDGGVTPLGEPYLVMELVEGQRIDEYCDNHRLDLPDRVRLFREVCAGVAFAHRNLVLHRDLKPWNILVTADGRLKIVDFGTAALLASEQLTTLALAPMTPAYASPEQLTGQAVGTASDQYSLGLVLYQLLTGAPPFARRTSLIAAVERAFTGEEPVAPETVVDDTAAKARRTSLARLRRQLAGDLGAIVRRATANDPTTRYVSVEHLAEDLDRWLLGDPVSARPSSFAYLASRFVARHRGSVVVAAILWLSLVGATAVSIRHAAVARTESAKARQLNRFLTRMLSSANPSWMNAAAASAGTVTVRQVLDGAGALVATELGSTPEVEAEMRRTLGRTYNGLGAFDQARPHLERALELYRAEGDAHGVAFTQDLLGNVQMQKGDFKGAEVLLRQAVAYVRSRGDDVDPELRQLAMSDLANAIAYQRPGDEEALALMRESAALRPGSSVILASITYGNLAGQFTRIGRIADAQDAVREALRLMASQPSPPPPEHYSTLRTVGIIHWQQGEFAEAERVLREAAEGSARTRPANHPLQPNFKIWWGRALLASGDVERARPIVEDAYAGYRRLRPAGHLEMALPLITLGILRRADGRLVESEQAIREAREILQHHPASRDRAADAAGELGLTLQAMGRTSEARASLQESYEILQGAFGDAYPPTRQARARLAQTDGPD